MKLFYYVLLPLCLMVTGCSKVTSNQNKNVPPGGGGGGGVSTSFSMEVLDPTADNDVIVKITDINPALFADSSKLPTVTVKYEQTALSAGAPAGFAMISGTMPPEVLTDASAAENILLEGLVAGTYKITATLSHPSYTPPTTRVKTEYEVKCTDVATPTSIELAVPANQNLVVVSTPPGASTHNNRVQLKFPPGTFRGGTPLKKDGQEDYLCQWDLNATGLASNSQLSLCYAGKSSSGGEQYPFELLYMNKATSGGFNKVFTNPSSPNPPSFPPKNLLAGDVLVKLRKVSVIDKCGKVLSSNYNIVRDSDKAKVMSWIPAVPASWKGVSAAPTNYIYAIFSQSAPPAGSTNAAAVKRIDGIILKQESIGFEHTAPGSYYKADRDRDSILTTVDAFKASLGCTTTSSKVNFKVSTGLADSNESKRSRSSTDAHGLKLQEGAIVEIPCSDFSFVDASGSSSTVTLSYESTKREPKNGAPAFEVTFDCINNSSTPDLCPTPAPASIKFSKEECRWDNVGVVFTLDAPQRCTPGTGSAAARTYTQDRSTRFKASFSCKSDSLKLQMGGYLEADANKTDPKTCGAQVVVPSEPTTGR